LEASRFQKSTWDGYFSSLNAFYNYDG